MEIKQILYINKTKFVCDAVEKVCKRAQINCYTLEDSNDFAYLIDDLQVDAVVIDSDTLVMNPEIFWEQLSKATKSVKTVLMGESESGDFDLKMNQVVDMQNFASELVDKLVASSKND